MGTEGHSPGHCSPWSSPGDSQLSLLSSSALAAHGKHCCGARHSFGSTARHRDGDPRSPVPCEMLADTHSFSAHGYPFHACGGMRASTFPVKSLKRSHWQRHPQDKPFPCPGLWGGHGDGLELPRWGCPPAPHTQPAPGSRSRGVPGQHSELRGTHSLEKGHWRVARGTLARAARLQSSQRPRQWQGPGQGSRGWPRPGAMPSRSSTSSSDTMVGQDGAAVGSIQGSVLGSTPRALVCDQQRVCGWAGPAGRICPGTPHNGAATQRSIAQACERPHSDTALLHCTPPGVGQPQLLRAACASASPTSW